MQGEHERLAGQRGGETGEQPVGMNKIALGVSQGADRAAEGRPAPSTEPASALQSERPLPASSGVMTVT